MTSARKAHFIEELKQVYTNAIAGAALAERRAAEEAGEIQREARRKEDAKGAVLSARLATGHRSRRERAKRELETLIAFAGRGVRDFRETDAVAPGALVDVRTDGGEGDEERTLFILPVGAGTELRGPGGDGFVFVVTPASPLGRSLLGAVIGDVVEVVVEGHDREWEIVDLC